MASVQQAIAHVFTVQKRRILADVEATLENEREYRLWHITYLEQELGYSPMPEGKRLAPPFLISYPGARTRLGRQLLAQKRAELVPPPRQDMFALLASVTQ
jgi:hypothetical protein